MTQGSMIFYPFRFHPIGVFGIFLILSFKKRLLYSAEENANNYFPFDIYNSIIVPQNAIYVNLKPPILLAVESKNTYLAPGESRLYMRDAGIERNILHCFFLYYIINANAAKLYCAFPCKTQQIRPLQKSLFKRRKK